MEKTDQKQPIKKKSFLDSMNQAVHVIDLPNLQKELQEREITKNEIKRLLQERDALLNSIANGIFGVDLQGNCTFINKAGLKMLGFMANEVIGNNMHTLTHHHHADGSIFPKKDCPLYEAYQTGHEVYSDNDAIWKKDGTMISVEYRANAIKVDGKIIGTVVSFNDISLRQEREQRKDEFLSIASHELKTPITTIKAFTQLLQKYYTEATNQKAISYLSRMDIQVDKLTGLIQDLLDVSKIQAGKIIYNKEIFYLDDLLQEAVSDLQLTSRQHRIIKEGKTDTYIKGDKYRILQVITNLISNAIKYSPQSNRIILQAKPNGKQVEIAVRDFGIGIPEEEREKVFDRFYRVSDKKRESFPGLGIGLYICNEIIRRHGGEMGVENAEGKGSRFYFTLPKYDKTN